MHLEVFYHYPLNPPRPYKMYSPSILLSGYSFGLFLLSNGQVQVNPEAGPMKSCRFASVQHDYLSRYIDAMSRPVYNTTYVGIISHQDSSNFSDSSADSYKGASIMYPVFIWFLQLLVVALCVIVGIVGVQYTRIVYQRLSGRIPKGPFPLPVVGTIGNEQSLDQSADHLTHSLVFCSRYRPCETILYIRKVCSKIRRDL